jgi:hypothetical protein
MKINLDKYDIPTAVRFGVSYDLKKFLPVMDLVYYEDKLRVHIGGELSIRSILFLRAGYRSGYDSKDLSAGAGFEKRNIRIDYAFLPFKNELGDSHIFSLTFSL